MKTKFNRTKTGARKAGELLRRNYDKNENFDEDALNTLSWWRESHQDALDMAFIILQKETQQFDSKATFAKRLKRAPSIIEKLSRFSKGKETSKLDSLQDIGGCRVIVDNVKTVKKISQRLNENYAYRLKNDYIKTPKSNGYKSIHLVGKIKDFDNTKSIEFQIRTRIQHYWATTLEIFDLFNKTSLKTGESNYYWETFWKDISDLFDIFENNSRLHSSGKSSIADKFLNDYLSIKNYEIDKKMHNIYMLDKKLKIQRKLSLYKKSLQHTEKLIKLNDLSNSYSLITIKEIDKVKYSLEIKIYPKKDLEQANKDYLDEEKKFFNHKNFVTALVSTSSMGDIKDAYPNYFADSEQFELYLDIILKTYQQTNPTIFSIINKVRFFNWKIYLPQRIYNLVKLRNIGK